MILAQADVQPLMRCPATGQPLVRDEEAMVTEDGKRRYAIVGGLPVLVDFDQSVLVMPTTCEAVIASKVKRHRWGGLTALLRRLISPDKTSTRRNVERLQALLTDLSRQPLVLVVGGGSVGQGMRPLYDDSAIRLIAFDVYGSPDIQFIADAHTIPLPDGSVDAVIIQAVLEHVLEPQRVADEIWRALRPDGLVYAETPFLQQVHEGAYDFTRFTESGHRYLFKRFEVIASGSSGGPGSQLLWSIDYFVRSLCRSRAAGKAVKLALFWIRYFDSVIPESYASDAASGCYLLGRKSDRAIGPREAIGFYRGAQR